MTPTETVMVTPQREPPPSSSSSSSSPSSPSPEIAAEPESSAQDDLTVDVPPPSAQPASPAPGAAPFDRGAAVMALGRVNVQSCVRPDGPRGNGHVTLTFAPSGHVQAASVDAGAFVGTPVGGCIAGKFRGAQVPPFSQAPVRVGKSFVVR